MNAELVREIADQIVREQLLLNWRFYALIGAMSLVSGVIGNWLSSYMKKRAETYATKADMQEVLRQIEATTKATEQVRVAVSHADWVAREWRTTRRTKLEELLAAVYALERWLEMQQSKWIYKEPGTYDQAPMDKVSLLANLYFPELKAEIEQVVLTHRRAYSAILATARKTTAAHHNLPDYEAAMQEFVQQWQPVCEAARRAIVVLEAKCSSLMRDVAGA